MARVRFQGDPAGRITPERQLGLAHLVGGVVPGLGQCDLAGDPVPGEAAEGSCHQESLKFF